MAYNNFLEKIMNTFKQHLALGKKKLSKGLASSMALVLAILPLQGAVFAYGDEGTRVLEANQQEAEKPELKNPIKDSKSGIVKWDVITFGHYFDKVLSVDEKGKIEASKSDIKWRVLSVEGNEALLISEYGLTARAYNEARRIVTWDNSTVRSFLNGYYKVSNLDGRDTNANIEAIDFREDNFVDEAFSEAEKKCLVKNIVPKLEDTAKDTEDLVYLLSEEEATNPDYGFDEEEGRRLLLTEYAVAMGGFANTGVDTYGIWRLRDTKSKYYRTSYVNANGEVLSAQTSTGGAVHNKDEALRPVIRLKLDNDLWNYVGTTYSDGGEGDESKVKAGRCGEDMSYAISEAPESGYILTISGTGDMMDYKLPQGTPWYQYSENIKSVVIEDGITGIGLNCFSGLTNLASLTMPISIYCEKEQFTDVNKLGEVRLTKGSGTSAEYDEKTYVKTPWYACRNNTISLTIDEDVERIGSYYFYDCTELDIPQELREELIIGANAFGKTKFEEKYKSNEDVELRVYFDALEGTASFVSKLVVFGKPYGELPEAQLEDYLFRKWVLADGTAITPETIVGVNEEHSVFAVWMSKAEATAFARATQIAEATAAAAEGTIIPLPNIDYAGEATARAEATASAIANAQATATATGATPKPGPTATAKTEGCVNKSLTIGDETISIYFNLKDGDAPEDFFQLTANGKKAKFVPPTKEGYTFSGWYNTATGKRVHYINGKRLETYDEMILKALWTENKYNLRYRLMRPSDNKPVKGRAPSKSVKYTQYVKINDTVTAEGWRLVGWCTVPNSTIVKYAPGARVRQLAGKDKTDKKIVLYPVWMR